MGLLTNALSKLNPSLVSDAASGLGAIYGFNKGITDVQDVGTSALERAATEAAKVGQQTQFKPFTVTSSIGGATTTPTGGLGLTLSPEQQAIQKQLQDVSAQSIGILASPEEREREQTNVINMLLGGQSPQQREQEIMQRLQATVSPEQERARLGLEQRLANQGRLGVRTSMFGGTPEQLALEKAIAEQQAGLGVSAMEQAREEQRLQSAQTLAGLEETRARLGLAGQFGLESLAASYSPLEGLLATLQPSLQAADIAGAGQRQGAQLGTSLLEAGLTSKLGAEVAASNLRQQQIQAITNLLGGTQANTVTGATGSTGLLEGILDSFRTPTATSSANTITGTDFSDYIKELERKRLEEQERKRLEGYI